MSITNLTRKVLPQFSSKAADNLAAMNKMPEFRLQNAINAGDKSIVHVGMNEAAAAKITPDGINTIYTDALATCNAVAVIARAKDGYPVAVLSHYTSLPLSVSEQVKALEKHIKGYEPALDTNTAPKVFFNIRGYSAPQNPDELIFGSAQILNCVRRMLGKFFPKGIDEKVVLYKNNKRPAYFSSANIYQFDTADTNKLKVTTVGEKEHFFDLKF